ncbi:hypothetical protein CspeluHIS016_0102980 [Cutaneotrichosporon spelunceum]|uniref:Copper-fist domain-containing protein n=1 Tax=Cutaneotrichosporon spelunceum TaxID=1672016 RepID=A0AAD3TNM9_9TREE|nr:hypothetical protein CspeluHIS016_0102980 [Cutaneotrichosporon spelunceum]
MVLINDKKYACATCIKGHRVSGCTHTDRPLFEVKKKGRPATQCQFCRDKRKGGSGAGRVHTKCACGDLKNQQPSTIPAGMAASYQSAGAAGSPRATETKKGQPGSTPTFPNGLRDVHEMAAAAEALADLGGENSAPAEPTFRNLLNPCNCRATGRCRCCAGKRTRSPPLAQSPTRSPSDAHAQVTDSLIEMFKAKATTSGATPPAPLKAASYDAHSGSTTPTNLRTLPHLAMTSSKLASPDHRHHPVHTSPHVHKAKLYSPYSNGQSSPRHGNSRMHRSRASSQASSQSSPALAPNVLPHPPEISIPTVAGEPTNASSQHSDDETNRSSDMAIGVDELAIALAASDVDFMTYLNCLLSPADTAASAAFDISQGSAQPDPNLLNAFSGALPRPELEPSLSDVQELIAGALARQGVLQSPQQTPVAPPSSQPAEFNYFFNFSTTTMPSREEQMANYQISPDGTNLPPMQQPGLQFPATSIDPLQQFDDTLFFNQYDNGLSLQVPSLETESGRTSNDNDVATNTVPSIPAVSLAPPAAANHPDIIDLSKPLNSSDIDRIMQALMNQQARLAAGTGGAMPQPQVSPQPPRSNVGSIRDPDPFQQYLVDPDAAQNTHLQQSARPEHGDRDWLQKAWPNMLGQSVQRE